MQYDGLEETLRGLANGELDPKSVDFRKILKDVEGIISLSRMHERLMNQYQAKLIETENNLEFKLDRYEALVTAMKDVLDLE